MWLDQALVKDSIDAAVAVPCVHTVAAWEGFITRSSLTYTDLAIVTYSAGLDVNLSSTDPLNTSQELPNRLSKQHDKVSQASKCQTVI